MKPERQIEIFEVMIQKKEMFKTGLCNYLSLLTWLGFLSEEEERITRMRMNYYRPKSMLFYWWKLGEWQPREIWLNEQIERLKMEVTNEN